MEEPIRPMRFQFGKNWRSFSRTSLDKEKVRQARDAFFELLSPNDLNGKTFLDIGFGQGLALFFAQDAGSRVLGIDIDPDNIEALKATTRFFPEAKLPQVQIASIISEDFIQSAAARDGFDIVHSWGVLHHTGDMQQALRNAIELVKPGGILAIAIYNSHWTSPFWKVIKWIYNSVPELLKKLMVVLIYPVIYAAKWIVTGENPKKKSRGMDFFHDVVDWVGGYPYEYANDEQIRSFVTSRDFEQTKFRPAHVPTGCNEFVFKRSKDR